MALYTTVPFLAPDPSGVFSPAEDIGGPPEVSFKLVER
jgi:hypothetical protein